jgi:hypothetical protein
MKPTLLFSSLLLVVLIGYGAFEARKLWEGPRITIESPLDGSATSTSAIVVSGEAENISFLTINDAPAFTDESGHFTQVLSPPLGYTVVTVAATDRFGRRASKTVSLQVVSYCINKKA